MGTFQAEWINKTQKISFQLNMKCFVSFLRYLTCFFKLLKNKEDQPQTPNIWEQKVSVLERVMNRLDVLTRFPKKHHIFKPNQGVSTFCSSLPLFSLHLFT